jgi:hypothetical protein
MTDQTKIPAPEPVAWADDKAAAGAIGAVESADTKRRWMRGVLGTHAFRATAERLKHPLITLESAETWAAAREAAALAENKALRALLAYRVAGAMLYRDDGEMSDSTQHPSIDFKRDSAEDIEAKLRQRMRANYLRTVEEDAAREGKS